MIHACAVTQFALLRSVVSQPNKPVENGWDDVSLPWFLSGICVLSCTFYADLENSFIVVWCFCVPQRFKIKDTDGHKEVFEQTSSLCNSLRFRTQQIPNVAKVRVYRVMIHACANVPFASLRSVLRQLVLFGQFYIPSIHRQYLVLTPVLWTFGIPLEWCHRFSDSIPVQFVTFSETTDRM